MEESVDNMRVLWICNTMLPAIAQYFGLPVSNKEGWLTGMAGALIDQGKERNFELAMAFPVMRNASYTGTGVPFQNGHVTVYTFYEKMDCPEIYDEQKKEALTEQLLEITRNFKPDLIHIFGTEYPHTCAICEAYPDKDKLLISIQGLCCAVAKDYMADIPDAVKNRVTFRDFIRKDSIQKQQYKFEQRAIWEKRAIMAAGNLSGRTEFDKKQLLEYNADATYYPMNETLRSSFYEGAWEREQAIPHRLFVSQGDYPLKGLHYVLRAMALLKKSYPDVTLAVAGNRINATTTWKQRIKLSSYGKYLNELVEQLGLEEAVFFLGKQSEEEMKAQYLQAETYVCASGVENSPNSLGEAMLLGMPCVAARVGGIPSLFTDGEDGITFEGHGTLSEEEIAANLAAAIDSLWQNPAKADELGRQAALHARITHDREKNRGQLLTIYHSILGE